MDRERRNGHVWGRGDERPCWLEVDLEAVAANVRSIASLLEPATRICAVVKAEGYGLGAAPIARAALDAGATCLAVARVDEGVRLRQAGLTEPILLLAGFAPGEAEPIARHRLTPTAVQADDVRALGRAAARHGVVLPVHLKVDTGLTRFGALPDEVGALARLIRGLPSLRLDGLYTHFASADEPDLAFTRRQLADFQAVRAALRSEGVEPRCHAANSAATLAEPAARLDMVRLGITLSGHYPSADVPRRAALRPAVSLRARVVRVYDLPPGTSVGYGRTYRLDRPGRAALIPAGYADGVPRAHSNRAVALVRGVRVPLIGRVSMDQCVVDVGEVPEVRVGDEAVLFGRADGAEIGLDEFAGWSGTIGHEALCRVGPRVPRWYRSGPRGWWASGESSAASMDEALVTGRR
jgi:alanine racemase